MSNEEKLWYVENTTSTDVIMLWYCKVGYSVKLDEAEVFTYEDATELFFGSDRHLPWPKDYIDSIAENGVVNRDKLDKDKALRLRNMEDEWTGDLES